MPVDPSQSRRPEGATADIPAPLRAALTALIDAGQRIEAVKRYRTVTGTDLVTAKGVVDALAAGRPSPDPAARPGSVPRAWQTQSNVAFTMAKAIGLLKLMAWFCWLLAAIAAVAAGWQAYDRGTVRDTWPEMDAKVLACRLVEHQDRRRTIDLWTLKEVGMTLSLRCAYRYSVDGRDYTGETRSHSTYAPELTAAMRQWVDDHPSGSSQAIRYDPADPQRISLGDADAGFEPDTPEHRTRLAFLFSATGVAFFGAGLWLAAVKQRREASSGDAG